MKKKERTIFRKILTPRLVILAIEMLCMMSAILFGGVIGKLNTNATDILAQQTENRANFLLTEMIGNWSSLDLLAEDIDANVQSRLDEGRLNLDD